MIFKKINYNSPVILSFFLLSLVVLALGYATKDTTTILFFAAYKSPFTDPLAYIRIFGHVLGHASFSHYINNFLIILLVGPMLEEKYGSKQLLLMILFTALITGILHVMFFQTALLGASGIAFMLILLSSFVNLEDGRLPLTFVLVVIIYITDEVVSGLTVADNIAHITHIIGGICGSIFGFALQKNRRKHNIES